MRREAEQIVNIRVFLGARNSRFSRSTVVDTWAGVALTDGN